MFESIGLVFPMYENLPAGLLFCLWCPHRKRDRLKKTIQLLGFTSATALMFFFLPRHLVTVSVAVHSSNSLRETIPARPDTPLHFFFCHFNAQKNQLLGLGPGPVTIGSTSLLAVHLS